MRASESKGTLAWGSWYKKRIYARSVVPTIQAAFQNVLGVPANLSVWCVPISEMSVISDAPSMMVIMTRAYELLPADMSPVIGGKTLPVEVFKGKSGGKDRYGVNIFDLKEEMGVEYFKRSLFVLDSHWYVNFRIRVFFTQRLPESDDLNAPRKLQLNGPYQKDRLFMVTRLTGPSVMLDESKYQKNKILSSIPDESIIKSSSVNDITDKIVNIFRKSGSEAPIDGLSTSPSVSGASSTVAISGNAVTPNASSGQSVREALEEAENKVRAELAKLNGNLESGAESEEEPEEAPVSEEEVQPKKSHTIPPMPEKKEYVRTTEDSSWKVPSGISYVQRKFGESTDVDILTRCFRRGGLNVLLKGPTGCGKSTVVQYVAQREDLPYAYVNLQQQVTVDDFVGGWIETVDGKHVWKDGPLTWVMRHGGVLTIEEINAASPEIMFILHRVLDKNREITLTSHGNELVKAHPQCHFCATMNPGYEGTVRLNPALKDRFDVELVFDYSAELEEQILPGKEFKFIHTLFQNLRAAASRENLTSELSTRKILQLAENCRLFGATLALQMFKMSFEAHEMPSISIIIDDIAERT